MLSEKKAFSATCLIYLLFGMVWGYVVVRNPENETLHNLAFAICFLFSFALGVIIEGLYKATVIGKDYILALLAGIFILGSLLFSYSEEGLFFGLFAVVLAGIFRFFER